MKMSKRSMNWENLFTKASKNPEWASKMEPGTTIKVKVVVLVAAITAVAKIALKKEKFSKMRATSNRNRTTSLVLLLLFNNKTLTVSPKGGSSAKIAVKRPSTTKSKSVQTA